MRSKLFTVVAGVLGFSIFLLFAENMYADNKAAGELLREAYVNLSVADHDYKGHRGEAMKHVQQAAKALGVQIKAAEGKGHEKQVVSDDQLRNARTLLQQARSQVSGTALQHVDKAIEQIDTALKIK